MTASGAQWWKGREKEQYAAFEFVHALACAPVPCIVIENPVGALSRLWRKFDQIIQPWQFGHGETKTTCLWLKNLPPLQPTKIVEGRESAIFMTPQRKSRSMDRSLTYTGIAEAMAMQWGDTSNHNFLVKI